MVYLDDIIVYSRDVGTYLDRLRDFERLQAVGLKLKPSKCRLFQRRVGFLGHIVSEDEIETDPEKIEAVATWPVPECVRDLRSFIGLCSYYRRFVRGFAEVAAPLHALTGKYAQFEGSEECQLEFEKLNEALPTSPILGMPSDEGRYILDTDASETSIGAGLSHVQNGEERVTAYASRKYNKAERNYCTTRNELLALVYFIRQFKQYLLGSSFLIITGHAALTWLQRASELIGQQGR